MPIIDAESRPEIARLPSSQPVRMTRTKNAKRKQIYCYLELIGWL